MTDMSHLDSYYLSGPATPMSRSEKDEFAAWRVDYARRTQSIPEFRSSTEGEVMTPDRSVDVTVWIRTLTPEQIAYVAGAAHGRLAAHLRITEARLYTEWAQRAANDPDCQVIRPW